LGTKSEIKVNAVKKAFLKAFPSNEVQVLTCAASSNINEQPVGYQETLLGASNRLDNTKEQLGNRCNYFVAIENGIIETGVSSSPWLDLAWVILEDKHGQQWVATSGGIPFSVKYVEAAKDRGYSTTTVADTMAKDIKNLNTKDPHSYLTGGLVSREDFLYEALLSALGQSRNT